ncbi:MAG: helix-turn-helix domain-containing protein [Pseudomonadota bacterium]
MTAFKKLKTIREFEKVRMPHLRSHEDFDIVIEVGYYEDMGKPLTLKCLLLMGISSVSTVQRRVHTLVEEGIITRTRSNSDRRSIELGVSIQTRKLIDRYVKMLHTHVTKPV